MKTTPKTTLEQREESLVAALREWLAAYQNEKEQIFEQKGNIAMAQGYATSTTAHWDWGGGSGASAARNDRLERTTLGVLREKDKLLAMQSTHEQNGVAILAAIDRLDSPKHQKIMQLRYLDGLEWSEVVRRCYGDRPDFDEKRSAYTRRIYRDHKRALHQMAEGWGEQRRNNGKIKY